MSRFALAWRILTNGEFAATVQKLLEQAPALPAAEQAVARTEPTSSARAVPAATPSVRSESPVRSDALTLLSTLQREGRLIDFLKEPLDAYSDAQVGAAVRDIHRDCGMALERLFAVRPVVDQPEGSTMELGMQPDISRFRISGGADQSTATSGRLVHHGWQVTQTQLPQWTGSSAAAMIIAPAEVELQNT